ncbi:MAG: COX15/CtaA family protein [Candidatus Omnitrophica bacterium]|nr:COX15/CtaA family protein [Candidatus Omnitrophota bacterium]
MYTRLLVCVTFLLVIAGGLVTSTKSGLSVPDWPLSYGQLMPPMVGGVRYEHTHRLIASLVGFMTFVLTLWLGFQEKRPWVRWLGITAFGAVVVQGVLGGLTVLMLLPPPISIFHACLAQTFFALVVGIAFFTSQEWFVGRGAPLWAPDIVRVSTSGQAQRPAPTDVLKAPLLMMIALIYAQLVLGATLRHTSNSLVVISHVVGGFLVLFNSIVIMTRVFGAFQGEARLFRPALALGVISLLQMTLGMGSFIYLFMLPQRIQPETGAVFFITAHQSLGALLLAVSVFFALRIYRRGWSS